MLVAATTYGELRMSLVGSCRTPQLVNVSKLCFHLFPKRTRWHDEKNWHPLSWIRLPLVSGFGFDYCCQVGSGSISQIRIIRRSQGSCLRQFGFDCWIWLFSGAVAIGQEIQIVSGSQGSCFGQFGLDCWFTLLSGTAAISREMQLHLRLWYTAPHKRNSPHVAKFGPAVPNNTKFCQKFTNIAKWLQLIQQAILELTWVQLPVISLLSVSSSPLPLKKSLK